MKRKSIVLCLLLLVLSLSSCKKKVELEEKEYWQGSVDDDFVDNEINVKIDKNFSNREFTVEDFKEIGALECKPSGSYPETIGEESFMRNWYTITLSIHSKQNVLDSIRIIQEYDFVKYAEPIGYLYPENLSSFYFFMRGKLYEKMHKIFIHCIFFSHNCYISIFNR